jgi:chemotaxis protein CheY-P-specific phosphatase CheC
MLNIVIEQNETTIREEPYLSPGEIRKLFDLAQNGATGSANSLQDLFRTNTDIYLNCLSFLPLPILLDRVNLFYPNHLGFHLRFSGEISGGIYIFFREQDAQDLIEPIAEDKKSKSDRGFTKIETSVLSDFVNILANSMWKGLIEKTALNCWFTPPVLVSNLSRSLSYSAKVYTLDHLMVHLEYLIPAIAGRVQLVMLPNQNTWQTILTKLSLLPQTEEISINPS